MPPPLVGIVANPVSARDIRRVIANASSLQITDRANIVLRVLSSLKASGVDEVLMMPEAGGIRGHVERNLARASAIDREHFPRLRYVEMRVAGGVEDTHRATREMVKAGVAAIVVLGGDGTHRAVAAHCGTVPLAGISTGTNNAFPEHREPTITGLAVGLAVTGKVPKSISLFANKRIDVAIHAEDEPTRHDIAIVDAAIVTERYVGARALWRIETFRELYVTFADPEVIGMSAIAGLLEPVSRAEPGGLMVELAPVASARQVLRAPIAPGMTLPIGVASWRRLPADEPQSPATPAGSIALDGERELTFDEKHRVEVRLTNDAFHTIDVAAVMRFAAKTGLMLNPTR